MAVSPDMAGFAESAGLSTVAYGPDTREQMKSAAEVVGRAQNSMSLFPEVMARVIQMWVDKSATLASLAHGADLLLAGINEQAIAANVAECQGIPLAALALLPGATFLVGAAVPEHDEGGRRRAASCAGLAGGSGLRTRRTGDPGYEESCVPGLAAEWGESAARRPFVGALTVETLNATLSGRGYSAISSKLKVLRCNAIRTCRPLVQQGFQLCGDIISPYAFAMLGDIMQGMRITYVAAAVGMAIALLLIGPVALMGASPAHADLDGYSNCVGKIKEVPLKDPDPLSLQLVGFIEQDLKSGVSPAAEAQKVTQTGFDPRVANAVVQCVVEEYHP